MDNKLNEILRKISRLRAEMLSLQDAIRLSVNNGLIWSEMATRLMAAQAEMVDLIRQRNAIACINDKPRPLALYFFGNDATERGLISSRTTSGALVVNDAMTHVFVDSLPFGGVGASGMGHYHGEYGFRALSHAKPVLLQSEGGETNLPMRAPYLDATVAEITGMIEA